LANFYGEVLMLMPAFSCLSARKMAEPIWYYSFLTISLIIYRIACWCHPVRYKRV